MSKTKVTDVRDEIMIELKAQERNLLWLSKKVGIPYASLYNIFKHKTVKISQDKLDAINKILNTKFKL